jgi:hypothetical protein
MGRGARLGTAPALLLLSLLCGAAALVFFIVPALFASGQQLLSINDDEWGDAVPAVHEGGHVAPGQPGWWMEAVKIQKSHLDAQNTRLRGATDHLAVLARELRLQVDRVPGEERARISVQTAEIDAVIRAVVELQEDLTALEHGLEVAFAELGDKDTAQAERAVNRGLTRAAQLKLVERSLRSDVQRIHSLLGGVLTAKDSLEG